MSWFILALITTVMFGLSMAFYKFPTAKNQSRYIMASISMVTAAILATLVFFQYFNETTLPIVLVATIWGISFTSILVLNMYALKHVDTNFLFPITSTLAFVITVLAGVVFWGDVLSTLQILGIMLAGTTIFLFSFEKKNVDYTKVFILTGSGIVLLWSFNKILRKIIADSFPIEIFQIYQYATAAVIAIIFVFIFENKEKFNWSLIKPSIWPGIFIGATSFLGSYSLYLALQRGPFSLITGITSFTILVTAVTGSVLFKEKFTKKTFIFVLLAVISIILIRLG